MTVTESIDRIAEGRLIAIVRLQSLEPDQAVAIASTLVESGVATMEITLDTDGALPAIEAVAARVPAALVGAGTVLSAEGVSSALDAGARFLVTPNVDTRVIATAVDRDVPVIPGALTPTEILLAVEAGAPMIKLFPAGPMGVGYLKAVRGPLGQTPLVPTGGIGVHQIPDYLVAGGRAVGMGSALVRSADADDGLVDRAAAARRAADSV